MSAARPGRPLARCHDCALLLRLPSGGGGRARCPRCGAGVHRRKPDSLARTWALVIAAALLYVPANAYPVMRTTSLGSTREDTILSGVSYLLLHGSWPLALIVFVASVLVPLLKIAVLSFLLLSLHLRSRWRLLDRTRIYRIVEAVGRWSMVDIYVVTILVALVHLGALASVHAGTGALFFGAVVVLTMLAAESFDPRLLWDRAGRNG